MRASTQRTNVEPVPTDSRIRKRYEEALTEAKNFFLRKIRDVKAIYCVGSVARGDPGPYSDIDIVIISTRTVPYKTMVHWLLQRLPYTGAQDG